MTDMLNIYDLSLKKTAVIQNAHDITETQELNKIYSLDFKIPSNDEKIKYLKAFHYVRYGEDGELYRIVRVQQSESDTGILSVSCEHAIATLIDDVMFGAEKYGGGTIKTADTIDYLLSKQKTSNWKRGECDFTRRFEYLWEQENILNALYSVPKEFVAPYKWVFNTNVTPWLVSLKKIDSINTLPEYYIRAESNLLGSDSEQNFAEICTRIYPLGYGEGVNQLGIREINNDIPYIENVEAIAKYGIKEKVLVDRRYESAESLLAYAQTMLDALSTPSMARSFNVVDLYPLTGAEIDNAKVGQICKLTGDGTITYITKTVRVLDDPGNLQIELSTKATDVASQIADLADRVRIESVYAQGATQLYQHSKEANAAKDAGKGLILNLYFPSEMKQINKVLLKVQLDRFRSYSQATSTTDSIVGTTEAAAKTTATTTKAQSSHVTSDSGGGSSTTTESGGGTSKSTESGGGGGSTSDATTVSGSGSSDAIWTYAEFDYAYTGATGGQVTDEEDGSVGYHSHSFSIPSLAMSKQQLSHSHNISVNCGSHSHDFSVPSHSHNFNVPSHSHNVTIPSHSHKFTIPEHNHKVTIEAHKHDVTIPGHSHSITPGIFDSDILPKQFGIWIGGVRKQLIKQTDWEGDITQWLLNEEKKIPRDTWIKIELRPNDLAYIISSVFVQGFVQSRGGGNY